VLTWSATRLFIRLVTLTFDLLTLEMVCNVTRGTDNLLTINFGALWPFCRTMDKHASNRRRDVIALTFDFWSHRPCRWCGSRYSIRVPSLKFADLPVPKIWRIFVSALIGMTLTLTYDLSTSKWGHGFPLANFQHATPSFRSQFRIRHAWQTDRQTDWQTDGHATVIIT